MNEKIYHPAMFRSRPLTFIIGCIFVFPPLYWFLLARSESIEISNGKITYTKGLLSKDETVCDLSRVSSVKVKQSASQRIFGAGDILVNTAGDVPEVVALGFGNPNEIKKAIESQRS